MKHFRPTPEAITAAAELTAIMALHDIAKQDHKETAGAILSQLKLPIPEDSRTPRMEGLEYITPAIDYLIDGLDEFITNPTKDNDYKRYWEALDSTLISKGWIHGANAECKISNYLITCKHKLFDEVSKLPDMPQIDWEKLVSMPKLQTEFFELTLKLLVPYIGKGIEPIKRAIFSTFNKPIKL